MLAVADLSKSYGSPVQGLHEAIRNVGLTAETSEFVSIVGPSGCGKTTLLKCISGLTTPTTGTVHVAGRRVQAPPKEMALVFQDYSRSLMPWMTVRENVLLPLRNSKLPKLHKEEIVIRSVQAVGLGASMHRYPWQLSGGMQQRTAIARALAYQPQVLLMDEPFASVDAQTRGELEDLLLSVWADYGVTLVFVTHDIDESVYLSDKIVVLSDAPSTVKATLAVDLPRPRDQYLTKQLPQFAQIRSQVYALIHDRTTPNRSATGSTQSSTTNNT
jgi:NitT/TauT family transport system ATP-binding protein